MSFRTTLRVAAFLLASTVLAARLGAATFTVTLATDGGAGTLRQAILDANATPGPSTINFAIPGSGPHTILPMLSLPAITGEVTIDGTTQPGFSGTPLIEIDGTNSTTPVLTIGGAATTVRGLVINRANRGIQVDTDAVHVIEGNYIGTDSTGTIALGCTVGVYVNNGTHVRIGGTTAGQRNLISGNDTGILVTNGSSAVIEGNYIGTDASGDAALGNNRGIDLETADNTIVGGGIVGAGNVISSSTLEGIFISSSDAVSILGNFIGTDATGLKPLGNQWGIAAQSAAGLVIGTARSNVISGNAYGISLSSQVTGASIQGNFIGTDANETVPLGNTKSGIFINTTSVSDNLIGGDSVDLANVIAWNSDGSGYGAIWNRGVRNTIRGNSMYSNVNLGIDNDPGTPNVVEANDPGDADGGPNLLQNFPVPTLVTQDAISIRIQGILHSAPSTAYQIDFYSSPACSPRPHDFLEGQSYLGWTQRTTDGSGTASIDSTFAVALEAGAHITMTATDPLGNTSEFSQRIVFSIAPASGPPAGGTVVTLKGTEFAAGASVIFYGNFATGVNVVSDTQITATVPPLAPGTVYDVAVANTDGSNGTLEKGWVADFLDVPPSNTFYAYVTKLVSNGIAVGGPGGFYGVTSNTLRQQMAVFLLKAKYGVCYTPPPCTTQIFTDVPCSSGFAPWINALVAQGITGGCGDGTAYCPANPVLRQQMAVLLLRTLEGTAYAPPACTTATFTDVPCSSPFAPWIYELVSRNITAGCGSGNYCPTLAANRGQMATFVVKTFSLQ